MLDAATLVGNVTVAPSSTPDVISMFWPSLSPVCTVTCCVLPSDCLTCTTLVATVALHGGGGQAQDVLRAGDDDRDLRVHSGLRLRVGNRAAARLRAGEASARLPQASCPARGVRSRLPKRPRRPAFPPRMARRRPVSRPRRRSPGSLTPPGAPPPPFAAGCRRIGAGDEVRLRRVRHDALVVVGFVPMASMMTRNTRLGIAEKTAVPGLSHLHVRQVCLTDCEVDADRVRRIEHDGGAR